MLHRRVSGGADVVVGGSDARGVRGAGRGGSGAGGRARAGRAAPPPPPTRTGAAQGRPGHTQGAARRRPRSLYAPVCYHTDTLF